MNHTKTIEGVTFKAGAIVRPADVPGFLLAVTNDAGRVFNVRLVRTGELLRIKPDGFSSIKATGPILEFYDSTFANKPANPVGTGFGPLGQFVSDYYAETLQEALAECVGYGLLLDGGVPVWKITGGNLRDVVQAYEKQPANA